MQRFDGSVRSKNNPVWENRSRVLDFGLYFGIVIGKKTPGVSVSNTTQKEQTYSVRLIGGMRDGHVITDVRVSRPLGGRSNNSNTTLKAHEEITGLDFASVLNRVRTLGNEGGDYVYVQFVNGDTKLPVITGMAKHPLDSDNEVPEDIDTGQQRVERFNGIKTKIDENGNYSWSKDLGTWLPFFIDPENPTTPFVNEFVTLTGQEEFFKLEIDGTAQTVEFSTTPGMAISLDVLSDSIGINTTAGAALTIDGLSDSVNLATTAGASINLDGLSDQIDLTTTSGSALSIGPSSGSFALSTGTGLELTSTSASLLDPTGAGFKVENGMIALGGPAAELVDLIDQAFTALSSQTAPGFGAPTSTIATFVQLAAQIKAIKGSL